MNRATFSATLLAIAVIMPVGQTWASIVEWSVLDGGNGHFYEFVDDHVTWPVAYADANSRMFMGLPGHLATNTSLEENAFVAKLTNGGETWIGLTDSEMFGGVESIGQPNRLLSKGSVPGIFWREGRATKEGFAVFLRLCRRPGMKA